MRLEDKYYKGTDVQKILVITEPQLRTLVANKQLHKVTPPGRKNAVYSREEVDKFAAKWQAFLIGQDTEPITTFESAIVDDMENENELDRRTVGGAGMSAEVRRAWLETVPELDYHVKHNGKLVAFLRLLPLKHEIMQAFMNGEVRGKDIKPQDLETLTPGKEIECLVIGISGDPDVDEQTRMHYVFVLLRGAGEKLAELGRQGIVISHLYATSESPTGIATALQIGMQVLPPTLGKRTRFILNPQDSDAYIIRKYKEGLAEWKKEQEIEASTKTVGTSRQRATSKKRESIESR